MQAVLVLAHKNAKQIIELSKRLTSCFEVYIHFDTKCHLAEAEKKTLAAMNGVHVYQGIDVRWGGYTIAAAELLLLREAMKNPDISYFHTISGQDWPAKPAEEIFKFYSSTDRIFLRCGKAEGVVKSHEPILWWMKYYFHYDKMNRRSLTGKLYHRWTILWQTLKRTDKFKDLGIDLELYQGSNWCDLPRYAVEYSLDYLEKHPEIDAMLQTGFCSDEFIFQTILCNSPLKDRIVNENHRYILWKKKYENYPAVLDATDLPAICAGDYHFIRKVDLEISKELIQKMPQ